MWLTIILSIYFIPIIIFWILVYYDMKKGQSIEEFIEEDNCEDYMWLIFLPLYNWIIIISEFMYRIWNKIKKLRK
jgi:hypothetical protein